jgi:Ca2+-binding EF-hand superfamily protein
MADTLSPELLAEFKEVFALFDKDGSGSISKNDVGIVLRSLGELEFCNIFFLSKNTFGTTPLNFAHFFC